jgi:TM2 domain-containing membrane protein YozV
VVDLERQKFMAGMSGWEKGAFKSRQKSPHTAMILAFFLGSVGAHRFYLGQTALGILYLVFCWTLIPDLIGSAEVYFMPGRVQRYNSAVAMEITESPT